MSHTPAETLSGHFKDSVDTAAETLKAASSSARDFSEEASDVLVTATSEMTKLAESLRVQAVDAAKAAAQYARQEVEARPVASLAAALTAVVAVIGVVAMNRKGKPAAE